MSSDNGKVTAKFRVHAFDVNWAPLPEYPIDLSNAMAVYQLMKNWQVVRRAELVDGQSLSEPKKLVGLSCMEIEVFYE